MKKCIFCEIIKGDFSPVYKVYEDQETLAFLDLSPINKGHTLVIPKKHYHTLMDIPEDTLQKVVKVVKKIARALKKESDGITINQNNYKASEQIIPHLHFHIIPRYEGDGLRYIWTSKAYSKGEAEELAERIRKLID